jgi:hypothetical protein
MASAPALAAGGAYSLFATGAASATGEPSDPSFPPELFMCDETRTDGLFTACGNGAPLDVTFDTFDPDLSGVFGAAEGLRHGPILDALRTTKADVLCLNAVPSDDDKQAMIDAARGVLPNSAWFADTLDTPIDDPRDENGQVPSPPSTASCGDTLVPDLDKLLACLETNCATSPHDASSHLIDEPIPCIYTACGTTNVLPLLTKPPEGQRCWMCLLGGMEDYSSFGRVRAACTTNGGTWPMAWNGKSNTLLLSRYPITRSEQIVLPATLQRSAVIRAEIALPNGAQVDAYCAHTTPPPAPGQSAALVPYIGAYGSGPSGWQDELHLQTERIAALVKARSTARGRRAVVLGHFNTGPALGGAASPNADSFAILQSTFAVGAAPSYSPSCTLCLDNPLVSSLVSTASVWEDLVLLAGVPVTSVTSSSVVWDQRVISLPDGGAPLPLSQHYGYRAVVRLHP